MQQKQTKPPEDLTSYDVYDCTGKNLYHVFEDGELLNDYSLNELNRLVHDPNMQANNWSIAVTNIRKGTITNVIHHCSQGVDHARADECVTRYMHQNYCPCWEYDKKNGWYRCGQQQMVMSVACHRHRDDEMRKVFDKIRKQYPTYGRELNLPNSTPPQKPVKTKTEVIAEDAQAEEEEIERSLHSYGEVNRSLFVFSKVKQREEEQERAKYYRRKDTKEVLRVRKSAVARHDPMTYNGAEWASARYQTQFAPDSVRDGKEKKKFIPKLEEKTKNGAKRKGRDRIWNGGKKDHEQQGFGGVGKENEPSEAETSPCDQLVYNGPEGESHIDRITAKFGINQKSKEKTRGGKKKD